LPRSPRVVLAGYFVRFPVGGYVWQTLHHLLGFSRLGCDVFFYEDTAYYPIAFHPETGEISATDFRCGVERLGAILDRLGLGDRWAFWNAAKDEYHGGDRAGVDRAFATADVFVNLGGVNRIGSRPRPKASIYVDIDPAFTQIQLEQDPARRAAIIDDHDVFFTYGENIGTSRSPLPTGGLDWRPTRPPVVGDLWETDWRVDGPGFTTIGRWDAGHREVEFAGERYHWRKSLEWRKFLELPRRTGERFELAMDVEKVPEDLRMLREHGWDVRSPVDVSSDPRDYRRYVQHSTGEFSAAKDINVRLRSGWSSDRSVCYLAAGRPVIVQDTGFGDVIPTGRGLFAVGGIDDAAEAIRRVRADYAAQSAAARAVAREHFEATHVLRPLLEAAGW
jgi:hypothetical protein